MMSMYIKANLLQVNMVRANLSKGSKRDYV